MPCFSPSVGEDVNSNPLLLLQVEDVLSELTSEPLVPGGPYPQSWQQVRGSQVSRSAGAGQSRWGRCESGGSGWRPEWTRTDTSPRPAKSRAPCPRTPYSKANRPSQPSRSSSTTTRSVVLANLLNGTTPKKKIVLRDKYHFMAQLNLIQRASDSRFNS